MHRTALKEDEVQSLAGTLTEQVKGARGYSKSWQWGVHPFLVVGGLRFKLSTRGFEFMRSAHATPQRTPTRARPPFTRTTRAH